MEVEVEVEVMPKPLCIGPEFILILQHGNRVGNTAINSAIELWSRNNLSQVFFSIKNPSKGCGGRRGYIKLKPNQKLGPPHDKVEPQAEGKS